MNIVIRNYFLTIGTRQLSFDMVTRRAFQTKNAGSIILASQIISSYFSPHPSPIVKTPSLCIFSPHVSGSREGCPRVILSRNAREETREARRPRQGRTTHLRTDREFRVRVGPCQSNTHNKTNQTTKYKYFLL